MRVKYLQNTTLNCFMYLNHACNEGGARKENENAEKL